MNQKEKSITWHVSLCFSFRRVSGKPGINDFVCVASKTRNYIV